MCWQRALHSYRSHLPRRHGARTPLTRREELWARTGAKWDVCSQAYTPQPLRLTTKDGGPVPPNEHNLKQARLGLASMRAREPPQPRDQVAAVVAGARRSPRCCRAGAAWGSSRRSGSCRPGTWASGSASATCSSTASCRPPTKCAGPTARCPVWLRLNTRGLVALLACAADGWVRPPLAAQEGVIAARTTPYQRTIGTLAGVLTGLLGPPKPGGPVIPAVSSTAVDEIL